MAVCCMSWEMWFVFFLGPAIRLAQQCHNPSGSGASPSFCWRSLFSCLSPHGLNWPPRLTSTVKEKVKSAHLYQEERKNFSGNHTQQTSAFVLLVIPYVYFPFSISRTLTLFRKATWQLKNIHLSPFPPSPPNLLHSVNCHSVLWIYEYNSVLFVLFFRFHT